MTSSPVSLIHACVAFLRYVRKHDIQVVHVHHRRLALLLNGLRAFSSYRLIYTGHLTYRYSFLFWLCSPRVSTGVSQSVVDNLRRTTRSSEIRLIGNGCDFPPACPSVDLSKVGSTAVCIARLDPVKGIDKLLDAWRILLDRGHECRLVIFGEGLLPDELERKAKAQGLERSVEFRGFHRNAVAEIDHALFLVLPSRVEGQPIVTIEAATRGSASLVTNVDGSRDCVPPDHGLPNLVTFGDVTGLANA